jgi:hypothetical protein
VFKVPLTRKRNCAHTWDVAAYQEWSAQLGLFTKEIKSMEGLNLHVFQDIYYAENRIKKALPDRIEKATNRELTAALKAHLEETVKQIRRPEQVLQLLGRDRRAPPVPRSTLDAALIAAAQSWSTTRSRGTAA